jgi:hypothetical protein
MAKRVIKKLIARETIVDSKRRELLTYAFLSPALSTALGSAASALEPQKSHLSRFYCARLYDLTVEPSLHRLAVVGSHPQDALWRVVESLNYGAECTTTGHVQACVWVARESYEVQSIELGLIVLTDVSPVTVRLAVEEATVWMSHGVRVYLAAPATRDAVRTIFEAMDGRDGMWHVVRLRELSDVVPVSVMPLDLTLVSRLARSLLDPQENYCMPCLDAADWNAALSERLIDVSHFEAPTFAAIESELRTVLKSMPVMTPKLVVVSGPFEFANLKLRFRLQDLLREFQTPTGPPTLAAQASSTQQGYVMSVLSSISYAKTKSGRAEA